MGVLIGIFIVVPYVFTGGYVTLAWIDLFQGFFLMAVIIFVPLFMLKKVGGWAGISHADWSPKVRHTSVPRFFCEDHSQRSSAMTAGWGLGYFGQPHIVTKFMGIRNVHEISKSKAIGMSWMLLSLGAATFVGLVGIAFFSGQADRSRTRFHRDGERVFRSLSRRIYSYVLFSRRRSMRWALRCLCSLRQSLKIFTRGIFRKDASSKELLIVARVGVVSSLLNCLCNCFWKIQHDLFSCAVRVVRTRFIIWPAADSYHFTGPRSINMAPGQEFYLEASSRESGPISTSSLHRCPLNAPRVYL